MKVIVDWVANHSSFDNKWTVSNPDWYTKDSLGNITHPEGTDWTDVADLNYDNEGMRTEMIKMMNLWLKNLISTDSGVMSQVPFQMISGKKPLKILIKPKLYLCLQKQKNQLCTFLDFI